jgi:hypothetical protein
MSTSNLAQHPGWDTGQKVPRTALNSMHSDIRSVSKVRCHTDMVLSQFAGPLLDTF